jgi:hypothetical protein
MAVKTKPRRAKKIVMPERTYILTQTFAEFYAQEQGITVNELINKVNPPPTGRSNYTPPKKKRK